MLIGTGDGGQHPFLRKRVRRTEAGRQVYAGWKVGERNGAVPPAPASESELNPCPAKLGSKREPAGPEGLPFPVVRP